MGLKIAVLSDCYSPAINGVVTSISQQLTALRRLGCEVDLYCPHYSQNGAKETGVYRLSAVPFPFHKREQWTFPWPPPVLKKLFTHPYDVFHLQTPFAVGLIGLSAAVARGLPRIFHHHTLWEEYVDYLPLPKRVTSSGSIILCRTLANLCQGVITPSEEVKERFAGQGVKRPISVIPTGIDASLFQGGRARSEYEDGTQVCLYVGRLAQEKSPDALLRVFAKIQRDLPGARLWIVGDGPARASLESLARELSIEPFCHFFGFVPRDSLRDFMATAQIFLFTSQTETQGLVLLEAQSGGLPVVAYRASGVNEAVLPDETGFLVTAGEEQLMANLSVQLLSENDTRERFSRAAEKWSKNFSLEQMGQALVSSYEMALNYAKKPDK